MDATFCPRCGTRRLGAFRFCRSCGLDFDNPTDTAAAGGIRPAAPSASSGAAFAGGAPASVDRPAAPAESNTVALFAGVAWLAAAAVTAILAFEQLTAGNLLTAAGLGDEGLIASAAWNGLAALLTAYFGARCLRNPSKGFLNTSTAWGVVNVGWGVYQVANGATYWLFYVVVVASALAGVLSLGARDAVPASEHAE